MTKIAMWPWRKTATTIERLKSSSVSTMLCVMAQVMAISFGTHSPTHPATRPSQTMR